jgi:hypothetical protein
MEASEQAQRVPVGRPARPFYVSTVRDGTQGDIDAPLLLRRSRRTALYPRCGPKMIPVLGGQVMEGEQGVAILPQALNRSGVLAPILPGEDVEGRLGRSTSGCAVDLAQVRLHRPLDRPRHLVEHARSASPSASARYRRARSSIRLLPSRRPGSRALPPPASCSGASASGTWSTTSGEARTRPPPAPRRRGPNACCRRPWRP